MKTSKVVTIAAAILMMVSFGANAAWTVSGDNKRANALSSDGLKVSLTCGNFAGYVNFIGLEDNGEASTTVVEDVVATWKTGSDNVDTGHKFLMVSAIVLKNARAYIVPKDDVFYLKSNNMTHIAFEFGLGSDIYSLDGFHEAYEKLNCK